MSLAKTKDKSTLTPSKQSAKQIRVLQNSKDKNALNSKKCEDNLAPREAGSQRSFSSKVKSRPEKLVSQTQATNENRKNPAQQPQASKPDCLDSTRRKPSINPEIRRVAPKSDTWLRKSVEGSSNLSNFKSKYVSPYGRSRLPGSTMTTTKPPQNDVKPVDGRRPVLKMPASIPKGGRRKNRYVITVVGNEIKLLDPKPKCLRTVASRIQLPAFNNGATISVRPEKLPIPKRRRKKAKDSDSSKRESDKKGKDDKRNDETGKSVLKVMMQHENQLDNSASCDLDLTVARLNLGGEVDGKKVVKFSDRRTKMDSTEKPLRLTEDVALLEKLDPISNILNTECVDSVQRCQGVTDFLTVPTENPNPPFLSKRVFYDMTVMEELNFPPLLISDLKPEPVELPFVPRYLPAGVKRTLSWPMMTSLKSDGRRHPISIHPKKKRPKLETILSTRPKGFHHAKWLEKTVASDSQLKTKLLRDVIVSQVKKLLKRQAELRCKASESNLDAACADVENKATFSNT